ncbi:riboflavin synthase [Sanyastnella coralliicola]|uniref:riboflavin synthase n=1 Tax=Sanyastnella coralliicola TaxID=3069118 RepID=UPI0027B982AE|nr:riboflavin synthase [Longitalea sp. SCSIO 12813]
MFTGIIEALGEVKGVEREGDNLHFTISSPFTDELQIDQSVAHNGTCLTVVKIDGDEYVVTAIDETIIRTNVGELASGDKVNLERCMIMGGRLDGHIVQGHVDMVGEVTDVKEEDGSWRVYVKHEVTKVDEGYVTVPKGSITVNGVSLTVVDSSPGHFSVAIIPYTWEHTNFHTFKAGTKVNLEFDIIGKYVARMAAINQTPSAS